MERSAGGQPTGRLETAEGGGEGGAELKKKGGRVGAWPRRRADDPAVVSSRYKQRRIFDCAVLSRPNKKEKRIPRDVS